MTYVITSACVGTEEAACVEVCPVDCIHPTPYTTAFAEAEQLYTDPHECIDCAACIGMCPVEAIFEQGELEHPARDF